MVDHVPDEALLLRAIAATLGKPAWRHTHYSAKHGGHCAIKGCDCDRADCHGVVCGMQQAIDKHAADVRQQTAEEIKAAMDGATAEGEHRPGGFRKHATTERGWLTSACTCAEFSWPCPHYLRAVVAATEEALDRIAPGVGNTDHHEQEDP